MHPCTFPFYSYSTSLHILYILHILPPCTFYPHSTAHSSAPCAFHCVHFSSILLPCAFCSHLSHHSIPILLPFYLTFYFSFYTISAFSFPSDSIPILHPFNSYSTPILSPFYPHSTAHSTSHSTHFSPSPSLCILLPFY